MALASTYLFPVGYAGAKFRPVEITPSVGTAHTYKVGLVANDPTTDGFNRAINECRLFILSGVSGAWSVCGAARMRMPDWCRSMTLSSRAKSSPLSLFSRSRTVNLGSMFR